MYERPIEVQKNLDNILHGEIKEWQEKKSKLKTIGEFKALGRELRDKHNLDARTAIDILNNNL